MEQGFYNAPGFSIATVTPTVLLPEDTRRWIRNASDERAAQEGCRYSEKRGSFTVQWVEDYCVLYEGDKAGQNIIIDDWQYEYFMQVFGWLRHDDELNKWVRRFKRGSVWIPKKNAKSPTLAATGLYLLCGDGEPGQKCYSVARDGKQAMISHNHAMEMATRSEALAAVCKVNRTTGTITYTPNSSKYLVVTGENKKSTEGYNGSLLVDETHVVDRELMGRLSRAGISRHEPLHVEMSTAGDSVDGYGMEQYDAAVAISSGLKYDPSTYALIFSAPQNIAVHELRNKELVLDLGMKVNPTMGRIIRRNEFLDDWTVSQETLTNLRKFAMYRLNIWTKEAANWLDVGDWKDCHRKYTLEDLKEYPCVGGLDLSKTKDMTAFTLLFAVPTKGKDGMTGLVPHQWTWYWLPDKTVRQYEGKIDLRRWQSDTFRIVEEPVLNYEDIALFLDNTINTFDLHCVGFDPYNSDVLMKILYNDYGWSEDVMVKVKQTMAFMGPPTAELERMILEKRIRQNGCPILEWQFGHCQVVTDAMGNYRPVKPSKDDYRKIDGIISLILASEMFNSSPALSGGYDASILLYGSENTDDQTTTEQERIAAIKRKIERINSDSR